MQTPPLQEYVRSFLNWMKFDNEIIESTTEVLIQDSVIHMTRAVAGMYSLGGVGQKFPNDE
jgi:hypothetical protein